MKRFMLGKPTAAGKTSFIDQSLIPKADILERLAYTSCSQF